MTVKIQNEKLKSAVYGLSKTSNEGFLIFKENGLESLVSDPASVMMTEMKIGEEEFEEYNPEIEEQLDEYTYDNRDGAFVGVRLDNLHSILKQQGKDAEISLKVEEADIVIETEKHRFTLPVINLSVDDLPETGNLEFEVETGITLENFKDYLNNLKLFTDSTRITVEEETVEMEGSGNSGTTQLTAETETFNDLEEDREEEINLESIYALEYLDTMRKAASKLVDKDETLNLMLGHDFPCKMVVDGGKASFVLAPRIEED